jgi:hypothetical protein
MKHYSITRNNSGYVVGTGEQDVLRVASRRKAEQVVADASGLLRASDAIAARKDAAASERGATETAVAEELLD